MESGAVAFMEEGRPVLSRAFSLFSSGLQNILKNAAMCAMRVYLTGKLVTSITPRYGTRLIDPDRFGPLQRSTC
jgi:hypothetical protein